jgi:aspartate racemase
MKTIGILGGMGPLATSELFNKIIRNTRAEKDQEHMHIIIDNNTNIPDRTLNIAGKGESPLPEILKSVKILELAGADFLVMPCNTAHYYMDHIIQNSNIPIMNMLEETTNYVIKNYKGTPLGLLATDGTIKAGIYDFYLDKIGLEYVKPQSTQNQLMRFIYEVVKKGDYEKGASLFYEVMKELEEKGARAFILGCTELSVALDMYGLKGDFIDPMLILARSAIEYAGGKTIE